MDDESYESIFVPIISKVMETFQPSAVVLQCGADSLTGNQDDIYVYIIKQIYTAKCLEIFYNLILVPRRPTRLLQSNSAWSRPLC